MQPTPLVPGTHTRQLIQALAAVNHKVPQVGLALLEQRMSPEGQRAFAELLMELADLLRTHADRHAAAGPPP